MNTQQNAAGESEMDSFCTSAIHAGADPQQWSHGAMVPPITMSTSFQIAEPRRGEKFTYSRSANPTRNCLEECLAAIEGATYAAAFASGLAATTTATFLLSSGDHVLCSADGYGGTYRFFKFCAVKMGLTTAYVDFSNLKKLETALGKKPKMVWFELVTNPTLKIMDVEAVVALIKVHSPEAIICVDNTFLTPYLMRPLEYGADIVMHSISKYINGHGDVVMGCLATNREDLGKQIKFYQSAVGAVPSPFDSYLVQRGIRTLAIRMREHCKNAQAVAEFLETHPLIDKVLYPGLPSHSQHALAKKLLRGYGGMVSFYVRGSADQTKAFLKNLKIISLGFSLGGYESLAELPCTMTHSLLTEEERQETRVTDNLIRFSVGLENVADILVDLDQALRRAMN